MTPGIVEVNRWKSFHHKKIVGKTQRMQRLFYSAHVRCSLVLLTLMSSISTVSQAATMVEEPSAGSYEFKGLSIGAVTGYIDYKEPGLMREYGELYGVNVSYGVTNEASTIAYSFEGQLVAGRLLYDGADVNLNTGVRTPKTAPTDDYISNIRGTIGLFHEVSPMFAFTPYIGLGYRDLNDKIQGSGSYNRNVSYFYLPIGAGFAGWLNDSWSYSFNADIDIVVLGTVISKLSDVDSSLPDITNHNSGTGARATASIRKNFSRFAVHIAPFYQKWKMDPSDGVSLVLNNKPGTLVEPANESDFIGLDVGMDF